VSGEEHEDQWKEQELFAATMDFDED